MKSESSFGKTLEALETEIPFESVLSFEPLLAFWRQVIEVGFHSRFDGTKFDVATAAAQCVEIGLRIALIGGAQCLGHRNVFDRTAPVRRDDRAGHVVE